MFVLNKILPVFPLLFLLPNFAEISNYQYDVATSYTVFITPSRYSSLLPPALVPPKCPLQPNSHMAARTLGSCFRPIYGSGLIIGLWRWSRATAHTCSRTYVWLFLRGPEACLWDMSIGAWSTLPLPDATERSSVSSDQVLRVTKRCVQDFRWEA